MAQGHQKPDHGGNFYQTPRRVIDSVAWRNLSHRARSVLSIFQARHTGFNNGRIAMSLTELCTAIGDQNRGANAKAIAELIATGFLECATGADHSHARAREYRLTFIPSGDGRNQTPATNDYRDWRPSSCKTRKFGGAEIAPRNAVRGVDIAPPVKFRGADIAPTPTVIRDFPLPPSGAEIAPLLINQSDDRNCQSGNHEKLAGNTAGGSAGIMHLDELRQWANATVQHLGYGGARELARSAGVHEPALSRFRAGKSLPDQYRIPLQEACGRALPYVSWRAAA